MRRRRQTGSATRATQTTTTTTTTTITAAAGKKDELAGVGLAFYSQIYVLKVPIARLARLGTL